MSVNVTIKKKGLFKKDLKIEDVILDEMRYGIMDESYRLEEGKVGKYTVVFHSKHIGRGYEISFEKGEVNLNMPLPTSYEDIHFFYEYIKILCDKWNTKEFIREEEKATFDEIDSFIKMDIKASEGALRQIEENINAGKYENMYIFGAINPIAIGKKELAKIDGDVKKFGELMHHLQKRDLYYTTSQVYRRKDGTYFGVYVLTENVSSILPYQAKLLMADKEVSVTEWNIGLVADSELKGFIPYENFLNFIKKEEEYDSEHFIFKIKKKEIKELLDQYKIDI